MRDFTTKERLFLEKINAYKTENKYDKLHFRNLLSEYIPGYVLLWNGFNKKTDQMVLYGKKERNLLHLDHILLADLTLFIYELQELGLISIRTNKTTKLFVAYDLNCYRGNGPLETLSNVQAKDGCEINKDNGYEHYISRVDIELQVLELCKSVIYPLPLLNDLIKNKFQSISERRYRKQINCTIFSVAVASLGVILSAFIGFKQLKTETHFDNDDLTRIEHAIVSPKKVLIEGVKETCDTLIKSEQAVINKQDVCTDSLNQLR